MSALPFMLEMAKLPSIVVGGGSVATKRTKSLVKAGGTVRVIAPSLLPELVALEKSGEISVERRFVTSFECLTSSLLFLCTNDDALHECLYKNKAPRQLVYFGNSAQAGHFYVPAKIEKGLLTVSVSTAGASPSYTKRIKEEIEQLLPEQAEEELVFLKQARKRVLALSAERAKKLIVLRELADPECLQRKDREEWLAKKCADLETENTN